MTSDVFFMNDRAASLQEGLPFKAVKVLRDAGLDNLFKEGDTVGIKVHFGEYGNSLNLRPHWVTAIVDEIKRLGGKPVVVENNTSNVGDYSSRTTKKDHLETARRHGFTEETLGCPIWIADGDYGFDDEKVDIPNGIYMKHTYIGKQFLDLDAVIVLSHFKGHPMGTFGGAIKNVGIGMGAKRGKIMTHFYSHPDFGINTMNINNEVAAQMAQLPSPNPVDRVVNGCIKDAFSFDNGQMDFDREKCVNCGACFATGVGSGIIEMNPAIMATWPVTIADAAGGYMDAIGKDKFIFLNYAMDITPWCDCMNFHDKPLVSNIGVFASKDPVALDMACVEMAEELSGISGSMADDLGLAEPGSERFTNASSIAKVSQWAQINAAAYNGIGTPSYNLIDSKPAEEFEFWFGPYTPDNVMSYHNKEGLAAGDYNPGDFAYAEPKMSLEALSVKPEGMKERKTMA